MTRRRPTAVPRDPETIRTSFAKLRASLEQADPASLAAAAFRMAVARCERELRDLETRS